MYNLESVNLANANVCESCGNVSATHNHAQGESTGITFVIVGWISFVISIIFMPLLFGATALGMGFMVFNLRNQLHGAVLMFFGAASMVLGTLFSVIVAGTMLI
jgi:hypothetical protein